MRTLRYIAYYLWIIPCFLLCLWPALGLMQHFSVPLNSLGGWIIPFCSALSALALWILSAPLFRGQWSIN